ncbi:MAG: hypothetical protein ACR2P8_10435 [Myxococcota bacterium]
MTGVARAAFSHDSASAAAESSLFKTSSILFRMGKDGSSKFPFARFGMSLAYSFSGTTPAPAGGSVNEEKSA